MLRKLDLDVRNIEDVQTAMLKLELIGHTFVTVLRQEIKANEL